jgi:hypothetical protein
MLCTHFLLTEYVDPRHAVPAHAYPQTHAPPSSEPAVVPLPGQAPPSLFRRCAARLSRVDLSTLLYSA